MTNFRAPFGSFVSRETNVFSWPHRPSTSTPEKEIDPMLDTLKDMLANTKIPAMDAVQMSDLLQYLFSAAEKTLRIQIAEIVYRNDHDHPNALDIFLACTLPLAEKAASCKAHRLFIHASDWQIELMYDGAVKAMLEMFQCNRVVGPGTDAFRRYTLRALEPPQE
jgi:hypothetical protein